MIKLKNIIGLPSLQYHVDNSLSLHENVYRYSSESFIQLFAEARDAWRDGMIELEVEDANLIETTDIGLYGEYNGQKVPLDLPMIYEAEYKGRQLSHEEEARLDLIAHRQYDEDFKAMGGDHLQLVESLNDHPVWVDAVCTMIKEGA